MLQYTRIIKRSRLSRLPDRPSLLRLRAPAGQRNQRDGLLHDQVERGPGLHHLQLVVGRAHRDRNHPPHISGVLQLEDLPQAQGVRYTGIQVLRIANAASFEIAIYRYC